MAKGKFIDAEEKELIEQYERGEFVANKNSKNMKKILEKAASNYAKKDARINIRISEADLQGIKIKAMEEGLPYQTLIASIIHKFVSGRFA